MATQRTYHHGSLRGALIDAALQTIETRGYPALSLRDLAQTLGVSSAAPYRHFADRDALLRACASEGFRRLLAVHRQAFAEPASAESTALAMCRGFLDFADRSPGLFILMYDAGLIQQVGHEDELGQLLRNVYDGVVQLLGRLPEVAGLALQARVIAMWSTLYGYARLRSSGMLKDYMRSDCTAQQIEQAVIQAATGLPPAA